MTKRHLLLMPFLLAGLLAVNLSAATVTGSFKLTTNVVVTGTTIEWFSDLAVPNEFNFSTEGSGDFNYATGSTHKIFNLNSTDHPVGTVSPPYLFIDFQGTRVTGGEAPDLLLTRVFQGNGGQAECGAPPRTNAPQQTCTPFIGSPFILANTSSGGSTASFNLAGITVGGGSAWVGTWTAAFATKNFQQVLADLAANNSVTKAIAGEVTITAIPEPGTFALIGMGLIIATVAAKRLKKS
jgi:hypothetical protein